MSNINLQTAIRECNLHAHTPEEALLLILLKQRRAKIMRTHCVKLMHVRPYHEWFDKSGQPLVDVLSNFSIGSVRSMDFVMGMFNENVPIRIKPNTAILARNVWDMPSDLMCSGYVCDIEMLHQAQREFADLVAKERLSDKHLTMFTKNAVIGPSSVQAEHMLANIKDYIF